MGYSNSPLVTYTNLTRHHSGYRGDQGVRRLTVHCFVGMVTAKRGTDYFVETDRECSSNYVVGKDGDVGLSVEEKNRAWTTGGDLTVNGMTGSKNDYHAVTVECACTAEEPYTFPDATYNTMIKLAADICKRNGRNKLVYINDKYKSETYWQTMPKNEMLLTLHKWYSSNRSCPGTWFCQHINDFVSKVNALLGSSSSEPAPAPSQPVSNGNYPAVPFLVHVIIPDLNYRSEGSMNGVVRGQTGIGTFTIMEVKNDWGRLKSGAGWIYLGNPEYCTIGQTVGGSTTPTTPSVPATPSVPDAPVTSGSDNMSKIWNALKNAIGNDFGVAGVMGNLYAESAYRPENLQNSYEKSLGLTDAQYTAQVDAGTYSKDKFIHDSAGYGLAQWTYWSRKQGMYEYIKEGLKKSIGNLDAQLEYLVKELKGYTKVWDVITKATSIREASDIVLLQFERPADTGEAVQKKRASYGQEAYDKYHKATTTTPTTPAEPQKEEPKISLRDAYLNQARAWLGLSEPDGHKVIIDCYNRNLDKARKYWPNCRNIKMGYTDPWHWCSCFVSACAMKVSEDTGSDECIKRVPIEIACTSHRALSQAAGIFVENDAAVPEPAWLVLYDWDDTTGSSSDNRGPEDHIGIVESVNKSAGTFVTIEGNTQGTTDSSGEYLGRVARRTMQINGKYIRGFIAPNWGDETVPAPSGDSKPNTDGKTIDQLAHEVIDGKWGNGQDRKNRLGDLYRAVQDRVNELLRGEDTFQTYLVSISIDDLNIRTGPGTNYARTGKYTGKGVFTIVDEADGQGASRWGLLKAYANGRNGWISLDYAEKI